MLNLKTTVPILSKTLRYYLVYKQGRLIIDGGYIGMKIILDQKFYTHRFINRWFKKFGDFYYSLIGLYKLAVWKCSESTEKVTKRNINE